jgi:hypothetical protein
MDDLDKTNIQRLKTEAMHAEWAARYHGVVAPRPTWADVSALLAFIEKLSDAMRPPQSKP